MFKIFAATALFTTVSAAALGESCRQAVDCDGECLVCSGGRPADRTCINGQKDDNSCSQGECLDGACVAGPPPAFCDNNCQDVCHVCDEATDSCTAQTNGEACTNGDGEDGACNADAECAVTYTYNYCDSNCQGPCHSCDETANSCTAVTSGACTNGDGQAGTCNADSDCVPTSTYNYCDSNCQDPCYDCSNVDNSCTGRTSGDCTNGDGQAGTCDAASDCVPGSTYEYCATNPCDPCHVCDEATDSCNAQTGGEACTNSEGNPGTCNADSDCVQKGKGEQCNANNECCSGNCRGGVCKGGC